MQKFNGKEKYNLQSKYEIRTKDGESLYYQGFPSFIMAFIKNIGNMYYFRVNF
jgi:hypothetical protein